MTDALRELTLPEVCMPTLDRNYGVIRNDFGYASYQQYANDVVLLFDLFIFPGVRGMGHGSRLLDEFMTQFQDSDVVVFAVGSEFASFSDDEVLVEWYQRHGFKQHEGWKEVGNILVSR